MTAYLLKFDSAIAPLEQSEKWEEAANLCYMQWKSAPGDLNALLCAGTEAWLAAIEIEDQCLRRGKPGDAVQYQLPLWEKLTEIKAYGMEHFAHSAVFCAYFGYMMQCFPYFFQDYNGDYDGYRAKGLELMHRGGQLEPENPFTSAMALELYAYPPGPKQDAFHAACQKLWAESPGEEWQNSGVLEYFYCILAGDVKN